MCTPKNGWLNWRLSKLCGYVLKRGSPSCGMERRMVKKVMPYGWIRKTSLATSMDALIKTANNPRPVRQLCQETQHGIQDHHLDSPGARPEVAPALSLDMSEQVIQKQEEE